MADDKRISELPTASAPTGAEWMEIVQGGINKKLPLSDASTLGIPPMYVLDYVDDVDSSGGTITLNLNSQVQRMFRSPDSFATPKTIALSNTTNGLVIDFKLIMSDVAAVLTFPTNFTMQTTDLRWNDSAHTFTPSATGEHEFSATFDGTDWDMKATNPYP